MTFGEGGLIGHLLPPIHAVVDRPPKSSEESSVQRRSSTSFCSRRRRSRRRRSSVEVQGNITPEDLQTLLQQPRSRLMIEESHTLQAGTEMGAYMMSKQLEPQTHMEAVASRAPVGHLRPNSFARRVAMTAFGLWRREVLDRKLASRRLSGSSDRGSSTVPSRRNSVASEAPFRKDSKNSGVALSEDTFASKDSGIASLSAAAQYLDSNSELPEKARLLRGSFAAALVSAPRGCRGTFMATIEKAMQTDRKESKEVPKEVSEEHVMKGRQISGSTAFSEDLAPQAQDEERVRKPPKKLNRVSPDQSPRGGRMRIDSYDDLHPARRDERARRERLMEDSMYVENQMDKLRRGKVMLRDTLAKTSAPDLFENTCLYTAYAQQIRRRKEINKDSDSFSLPNLHQRPSRASSPTSDCGRKTDSGRKRRVNTMQNFYDKKKDEKKKGAEGASTSFAALQVRDLQAMMSKSASDLMNPPEEKAVGKQQSGKNFRKSQSKMGLDRLIDR